MMLNKIKNVNIQFHGQWNPKTHQVILKYDPRSNLGFSVSMVSINEEPPINNFDLANKALEKFRI
jgi:hypothetical protein